MTMPAYEEVNESPTENLDGGIFTATMKVMCAWADRDDLMAAFVADRAVYPHIPGGIAKAVRASAMPFGGSSDAGSGLLSYPKAIVTIDFADAVGISGSDPTDLYSETIEPWVENIPLAVRDLSGRPTYAWRLAGGTAFYPLDDKEAPVRTTRGAAYTLTRYRQASIPSAAFTLTGKVNASAVTSLTLGYTFEAQTLLFSPPTLQRTTTTSGSEGWDITYKFLYRPNFDTTTGAALGWNYFWRARGENFAQISKLKEDGTEDFISNPYPTGNFALL